MKKERLGIAAAISWIAHEIWISDLRLHRSFPPHVFVPHVAGTVLLAEIAFCLL